MKRKPIAVETLLALLSCDAEKGTLVWKERPMALFNGDTHRTAKWNGHYAGKPAFACKTKTGYLIGSIFDIQYSAHQVIFAMHHGMWAKEIDHINGVRHDNRIINLREVIHTENSRNMKIPISNKSGTVGVSWSKAENRWVSRIMINYKNVFIGQFQNREDAIAARKAAEIKHGFHPNHGRSL